MERELGVVEAVSAQLLEVVDHRRCLDSAHDAAVDLELVGLLQQVGALVVLEVHLDPHVEAVEAHLPGAHGRGEGARSFHRNHRDIAT